MLLVSILEGLKNGRICLDHLLMKKVFSSAFTDGSVYVSGRTEGFDADNIYYTEAFLSKYNSNTVVNEAPYSIDLSTSYLSKDVSSESILAMLTSSDPNSRHLRLWFLQVRFCDNNLFTIDGNELRIHPSNQIKSSYSIRLQTTDPGGLGTKFIHS